MRCQRQRERESRNLACTVGTLIRRWRLSIAYRAGSECGVTRPAETLSEHEYFSSAIQLHIQAFGVCIRYNRTPDSIDMPPKQVKRVVCPPGSGVCVRVH